MRKEFLVYGSPAIENAERIGGQTVSLPLSAKLTDEDVGDVIEAVTGVLQI